MATSGQDRIAKAAEKPGSSFIARQHLSKAIS